VGCCASDWPSLSFIYREPWCGGRSTARLFPETWNSTCKLGTDSLDPWEASRFMKLLFQVHRGSWWAEGSTAPARPSEQSLTGEARPEPNTSCHTRRNEDHLLQATEEENGGAGMAQETPSLGEGEGGDMLP
jgi:hypothetical protein